MKPAWLCLNILLGSLIAVGSVQADMSQKELRLQAMEEKINAHHVQDLKVNYGPHGVKTSKDVKASYGKKGFRLETGNELFQTNLQWRAQMRYSGVHSSDPRSPGNFTRPGTSNFELRRVRMKIGGHGYKPWLKYYFEVDLQPSTNTLGGNQSRNTRSRVIDWRIDVQPWDFFGIRVGQWKINYNRERVDSSGRQQFVERSIVNRQFTIDRQVGVMAQGRLFKGTHAELRYYAGVFNGEGKGVNNPDDNHMYMARIQWNFLGRDLKWRQSDVKFHKKPAGSLAFATAHNTGVCTRWSSGGCGNLSRYVAPGTAGQQLEAYEIEQYVEEFALKWQGLSLQQEYHWKNIRDTANIIMVNKDYMDGGYGQIGYFPHGLISMVPEGLEVAFRYAVVNEPDRSIVPRGVFNENKREEFTGALNYFIAGHNNKVTLDVSYLNLQDASTNRFYDDGRVRLQWDISF